MNDFLGSPFSPVMANVIAGSSAGFLLKIDSLENTLLIASSEKKFCLQKTVALLNQCIGKENQD